MELDDHKTYREKYLPQTFTNTRTEKTTAKIVRHELDKDVDLENYLIEEDIQRILFIGLTIVLIVFLVNTFAWG